MDVFSELAANGLVPSVASYNVAAVRWRRAIWSLMFMDRLGWEKGGTRELLFGKLNAFKDVR